MPDDNDDIDTSEDQSPTPAPTRTFTQEQVNTMLAREQLKVRKEFSNYADLKVAADEYNRLKEASKSTEERLSERALQAERERDEWKSRDVNNRIRVHVIAEAARQGATDPEDVAKLLDHSEIVVTDDGIDGVKEAVALLLASKRYLVDGRRRGGSELRGIAGGQPRSGNQITQSQIRNWAHGFDPDGTPNGGMTPERIKLIEDARKAGTIEVGR